MGGKGRALDNAITDRFWRTLKWEDIYIMQYETPGISAKELMPIFATTTMSADTNRWMAKDRPTSIILILIQNSSLLNLKSEGGGYHNNYREILRLIRLVIILF